MKHQEYGLVAGIVFLLVASLHFLRAVSGWEAEIGGWRVPMGLSWAAVIIAGFLSYWGFRLHKKK